MRQFPGTGFLAQRLDELVLATTLLTRIPMPAARAGDSQALGRAVWAYPIIGALVGLIGAGVFYGLRSAGLPAGPPRPGETPHRREATAGGGPVAMRRDGWASAPVYPRRS